MCVDCPLPGILGLLCKSRRRNGCRPGTTCFALSIVDVVCHAACVLWSSERIGAAALAEFGAFWAGSRKSVFVRSVVPGQRLPDLVFFCSRRGPAGNFFLVYAQTCTRAWKLTIRQIMV